VTRVLEIVGDFLSVCRGLKCVVVEV